MTIPNDVTAQAFREAAAREVAPDPCDTRDARSRQRDRQRLLLAAAEQREQLDAVRAELIDARHRIMELTQQLDIVMGLEGR